MEKYLVVDALTVSFEGLFSMHDLFEMIDEWFRMKGYDKKETLHFEKVKDNGKYIEILLEPNKKLTDYIESYFWIKIVGEEIKDAEVEYKKTKIKLNHGKINITIRAFLITDYEDKWSSKPYYFLIRTIFDRFIYKRMIDKYKNEIVTHAAQLAREINAFLNLYKTKYAITKPEKPM